MLYPPSTIKFVPVIHFELFDKKNIIEFTTSSYFPIPKGCFFSISEIYCLGSLVFKLLNIFESNIPAEIQFILTLFLENSEQSDLAKLICDIFEVEYNDKYEELAIEEIVPIKTIDAFGL